VRPLSPFAAEWLAISALLDEALGLPASEHATWLASQVGERAAHREARHDFGTLRGSVTLQHGRTLIAFGDVLNGLAVSDEGRALLPSDSRARSKQRAEGQPESAAEPEDSNHSMSLSAPELRSLKLRVGNHAPAPWILPTELRCADLLYARPPAFAMVSESQGLGSTVTLVPVAGGRPL